MARERVMPHLYLQPLPITALESSSNHPPPPTPGPWKNCFWQNQSLLTKDVVLEAFLRSLVMCVFLLRIPNRR